MTQLSLFDILNEKISERKTFEKLLSVGDKIGRVVLGEYRIATITKVEGLPNYPFYRTDSDGSYKYDEGLQDVDELKNQAEKNRKSYVIIKPENLQDRITVKYEPRLVDGVVMWAQIGIYENMLFWKSSYTYEFLEPYDSPKKLMKEYKKIKEKILVGKFSILEDELPMERLYLSNKGFYASAEYVNANG